MRDEFVVKKRVFYKHWGFNFLPRKWYGAIELTGVVCTISDLRIVPIFCNTKNLCETMSLLQETMHTDKTSCNVFSMTKYLTEMIVWLSLLIVKKSNRHILFKGMWLWNAPLLESILESGAWFCTTQYSCGFYYKSTNNQW